MLGSFSKTLREKLCHPVMVTLCLVDGKQAVAEALDTHIFLNPLLNK